MLHVKPKTMEVLVCLVDAAGQVVSRDDLLEKVWQNAYVGDDVITQAIAEIRRALGDDFRQPVFVETVPRRGYRVIQPVHCASYQPPAGRTVGESGAGAVPRARRWAALPPAVLASGVAVAVIALGWVAVRAGSDLADVASELRLLRAARRSAVEARPTHDTEAYELYLKARQKALPHQSAAAPMDEALSLARGAVARDPGFAEAHALIAEICAFKGFWNHGSHQEMLAEARLAAHAATRINPGLSYPHAVSGLATAMLDWNWKEGYRQAARATELDPNDARSLSLRAVLALTRGRSAEAVQLAHRAYELDPINPHALGILSWVLYQARQYDEAAEFMAKTLDADPDAVFASNFRPVALAHAGKYEDALAAERARPRGRPDGAQGETLGLILVLTGRQQEARSLLARAPAEAFAETRARLGDNEPLLEWLGSLVEKRMTNYLMWLRTDPTWDPGRDDPRFRAALERVGLTD